MPTFETSAEFVFIPTLQCPLLKGLVWFEKKRKENFEPCATSSSKFMHHTKLLFLSPIATAAHCFMDDATGKKMDDKTIQSFSVIVGTDKPFLYHCE